MGAVLHCPACGHELRPPHDERLTVGLLTFWPDTGIAAIGEKTVKVRVALGIAPCRILATLMRYPGRVVSVDEMMDASGTSTVSSLQVRLSSIRNLLGSVVEIRCERGLGYSIHPRPAEEPARGHKEQDQGARLAGQWFGSDELENAIRRARELDDEHERRRTIEKMGL